MKKVIFSFILGVGFGAFGYAAHKPTTQVQNPPKKESAVKEKVQKYDFSLFKFVKPTTKKVESDSAKATETKSPVHKAKDETTYHFNYEKPRSSFKFS